MVEGIKAVVNGAGKRVKDNKLMKTSGEPELKF